MLLIVATLGLCLALSPGRVVSATPPSDFPTSAVNRQADIPPALREAVEKSRYRIRAHERAQPVRAYSSFNPAHALRGTFTDTGVRVTPSASSAGSWQWGMSLRGYGYGEQVHPVARAELVVSENRIEYRRGPLTEWYVNDRHGLEQGFTVVKPPDRRKSSKPLVLVLNVNGDLRAELSADGEQVYFVGGRGERLLSYSKLAAFDATGTRLAARMHLEAGEVRLEVEDQGAAYPVTIDPLIASETKLEPTRPTSEFGRSVAIDGNTAVVGRPSDLGSAYVFVRSGPGWSLQQELFASDGTGGFFNDRFGQSVAISGDTIVVGAPDDDTTAGGDAGSAYVFVRSGTTWSEQAHLFASDGAAGDNFGSSVSISGDIVIVGAPGNDASNFNAGAAYVFVRTGTAWTQEMKLAPSPAVGGFVAFGRSVAIDSDTAVVGIPDYRTTPCCFGTEIGSVYVFVRPPGGTTWSQQAQLFASDASFGKRFGSAVAISGNTLVVGDLFGGPAGRSGEAYVFVRPPGGSTWTQQGPPLLASDAAFFDGFEGFSVAISGETIVIGVPGDDTTAGVDAGSAYVFVRSGTTWSEEIHLFASDGAPSHRFGASVGISGDTAIVGSPLAANTRIELGNTGAAYVYELGGGTPIPAALTLDPPADTNPVATQHCVTATVQDASEPPNPTPNVTVRFTVTGSVNTTGSANTDANGQAMFCYGGPPLPGGDAITAFADTDNDGTRDPNEPQGTAAKTWVAPSSTPGKVTGGGQVRTPPATDPVVFSISAQNTDRGPQGTCNVVDQAAGVRVKCLDVISLSVSGTHATIIGTATQNGAATTYRIDVDDLSESGAGQDSFVIQTASGYLAGGVLTQGNIQVHQ